MKIKSCDSGNENKECYNYIDLENRKIYLFDLIDEKTALSISEAFNRWRSEIREKDVEFIINSPGGYIETLISTVAEICNPKNNFSVYANVVGIAYSAVAIMLLYIPTDNIKMFSGSHVMFHYSRWSTHELNIPEHTLDLQIQKTIFDELLNKGLSKTKLSLKELKELMDKGDAHLTANQCLTNNIVGDIYG